MGAKGYKELGNRISGIEEVVRDSGRVELDIARSPGDSSHRTEYDIQRAHNAALAEDGVRNKYEKRRNGRFHRLGRKALSLYGVRKSLDEVETLEIKIAVDFANRQYDNNPLKDFNY